MAGSSNITGQESILFADNASYDGTERGGKLSTNKQLWIGSTTSPHVKVGELVSPNSTININYSSPNITLDVNASNFPIPPLKYVFDFDDFLGNIGQSNGGGAKISWFGSAYTQSPGTSTNPGIIVSANSSGSLSLITTQYQGVGSVGPCFTLGGGELTVNWLTDLGTLSDVTNRYIYTVGLTDAEGSSYSGGAIQNGCYLTYSDNVNSGKWQCVCVDGGVTTTTNTNVTAATGFHNYGVFIDSTASSVTFFIDGQAVAIITTHITSNPISPSVISFATAGTLPDNYIDLFYYRQILTTTRPG